MNDSLPVIKGYRTVGDPPKPSRELSMGYLQQSSRASKLLKELWDRAPIEGAPCVGNADKWTSDDLPSDREAQLMCSPCPLASLCAEYRDEAHPAIGVWSGVVKGRNLLEAMRDD